MNVSKRKWSGIALIASAFITWLVLVSFVYRGRVLESHSYSDSGSSFSFRVTAQSARLPAWIRLGLAGLGGLGVVFALMPTRRQVHA